LGEEWVYFNAEWGLKPGMIESTLLLPGDPAGGEPERERKMKELRTEIEINASPEKVWQILTDFDQYPIWNPFIHHAVGKCEVGGKVDITFKNGGKDMTLHCTVIKLVPNMELCWEYKVIHPGLWHGEHSFTIEPVGENRVRFVDLEVFTGLLIPFQAKDIDTNSRRDFEAMDKALKQRVEAAAL
jgi:hypothetical protein